jgi:hypothetical protein
VAPERRKKKITAKINRYKNLVNQLTQYEVLIAEKLAEVPVPDMADSIWARIEQDLDTDAPDDDGTGNDNPPDPKPAAKPRLKPKRPGAGFYAIIITGAIVTTVAVLLVTNNRKNKTPEKQEPPVAVPAQSLPEQSTDKPGSVVFNNKTVEPPPLPPPASQNAPADRKTVADTTNNKNNPPFIIPAGLPPVTSVLDTASGSKLIQSPPPVIKAPDTLATGANKPGRKSKGFQVGPNDKYGLEMKKKDTAKKAGD